jgi:hypothetical protein
MSYNGWNNYATWRVNLEMFDGQTAEDIGIFCRSELVEYLREMVEEHIISTTEEGLARDYALAFVSDVDYWQIADNLMVDE